MIFVLFKNFVAPFVSFDVFESDKLNRFIDEQLSILLEFELMNNQVGEKN